MWRYFTQDFLCCGDLQAVHEDLQPFCLNSNSPTSSLHTSISFSLQITDTLLKLKIMHYPLSATSFLNKSPNSFDNWHKSKTDSENVSRSCLDVTGDQRNQVSWRRFNAALGTISSKNNCSFIRHL